MISTGNKIINILVWLFLFLLPIRVLAQLPNQQNRDPYQFVNIDINDGLSNNQITSILKDSRGFMWFGTQQGLNRYNGSKFKSYIQDVNDSTSIPFNQISFIFEDLDENIWLRDETNFAIYNPLLESFTRASGNYKDSNIPLNGLRRLFADKKGNTWFLNRNNILYKYSRESETADSIQLTTLNTHPNNFLNRLGEDSEGNLWAITYVGELIQINPNSKKIVQQLQIGDLNNELLVDYQLYIDSEDNVWIFSRGLTIGVYILIKKSGEIKHLKHSESGEGISSNMVANVEEDKNGDIWVAMDHGGINILDKEQNIISRIVNRSDDKFSLAENSINWLYKDNENIMWVGTFKTGISYYHKDLIHFNHYKRSADLPNSLPFNDINCFAEDKKGNIWLGTNGGGLIYFNRQKNTFKSYKHNPDNPKSLSTNVIVSMYLDRNETLWLGTYQGGLNRFDGTNFVRYINSPTDSTSISDNRIWDIFEDSKNNFWVGTFNGGLNLLDRNTGQFKHYKASESTIGSNFVMSIMEDSEQKLWLGTTNGISILDLNSWQFKQYPPNPGVIGGLNHQHANDVHEDERGLIWVATAQGLNVFSKTEEKFKAFTELDGLNSSSIRTIEEDMQGNLWLSTFKGISKITVSNYSSQAPINKLQIDIENFGLQDGLQGNEFNQKSAYRTRSGELIYGGANGFNLFYPEIISDYDPMENIVLTNFKVFNQDVKVNVPFRDRIILEKSISYEDKIKLQYDENVFSFEFAALNYFHPEKNKFQYNLVGFNKEWLDVNPGFNEITFTNLDAGTYQLNIRSSNDNITWKEMAPPLSIEILPPFWKSKYAYVLYFLFLVLILFLAWRALSERQRLKFEAEQEHLEAERMQQVDALKTKFFTNISHEFRTPLALIISPLERLIEKSRNENQKNNLILIHRNARRLMAMVNQLLDFRKMELQKIEVKNSWGNMVEFIEEIGSSFEDLAENKHLNYSFSCNTKSLFTFFDKDKTDKIITNLLSNAFKFTPENREVKLEVILNGNSENSNVVWIVSDSGIGIASEQQEHIFERFYQTEVSASRLNPGSGIGLSMVNEYVHLLGGKIKLDSELNQGSTFSIQIPVQLFSDEQIEIHSEQESEASKPRTIQTINTQEKPLRYDAKKKTIAIIEDNEDFRFYLKDNLKGNYNILEAENGAKGWEIIEQQKPNLVVSDVMMPEMNGIELCQKIKKTRSTKHIPVILLTAKVEADPVIEGYESGADGYIAKPFDFRILKSRILNLINSREQLRQSYQSMTGISPEKIEVNSEDELFLTKALALVEQNIAEAGFTVEEFGREMGMSRVSLYKKILALTNKTPIEFIRIIRLKRAADLLSTSKLSVSEVAYQVGFNNPRYFSKYFSKEYEMLPSEYIAKNRAEKIEISAEIKDRFN